MKIRLVSLLVMCTIGIIGLSAQGVWERHPALSPDGSQVLYSLQGDIWIYDVNSGLNKRLTVHQAYDSHPQWNGQGTAFVFQSNRSGNSDIYEYNLASDKLRQITYHEASDQDPSYDQQGNIYFSTTRVFRQVGWKQMEVYILKKGQATPVRFLSDVGNEPQMSPDGRFLAITKGGCGIAREDYRGPANLDIWLVDMHTDSFKQVTTDEGQDFLPKWDRQNRLFFLSARDGKYSVYIYNAKKGDVEEIVEVGSSIRYFDISKDGSTIAIEHDTHISIIDIATKKFTRLQSQGIGDGHFYNTEYKTFAKATQFALSPDEKYALIQCHDEIYLIRNDKDNYRTKNISDHGWKDYNPLWMNDSTALFISDRSGIEQLYMLTASTQSKQFTGGEALMQALDHEIVAVTDMGIPVLEVVLSPDKKGVAIVLSDGSLHTYSLEKSGKIGKKKIISDSWATPSQVTWSPDSRWLAYSQPNLNFNEEIFIASAYEEGAPVNVSMHPRSDENPIWSPDGSKLAFLSERNNGDYDVWFAWLKKSDWEKSQFEWKESQFIKSNKEKNEDKKNDKDKKEEKKVEPVAIDLERIHERLVQVTKMEGNERSVLISQDGEDFYFSSSLPEEPFYKVKWNGEDLKEITQIKQLISPQISKDGKSMYYLSSGALNNFDFSKGKPEEVSFKAEYTLDNRIENQQVFQELWRRLNEKFYDPEFHGHSWAALKNKYEPMVSQATTKQDFRDMVNEMLGQLNASHMGLYGGNPEEVQKGKTALLGIEVSPTANGVSVTKVVPGSPADKSDGKLKVGDEIIAVEGQLIHRNRNFWSYLSHVEGEQVYLTIRRKDEQMPIVLTPVSSLRDELYEEWVRERKELTKKYSNGQLGYIHIQGMNWPSFERFERELTASAYGKKGLVIDVRYNGGGWTTDMLLTILNVRQHAYTIPRGAVNTLDSNQLFSDNYPYGERLPFSAWTQPSITLCNEFSYSNAEIFSHAFKNLGLGSLVGQPTFGAVISTDGRQLMDGSFIRLPFRAWYVKKTGKNMEGTPAMPDVLVENGPRNKANGEDFQLKKAVEVLMSQL